MLLRNAPCQESLDHGAGNILRWLNTSIMRRDALVPAVTLHQARSGYVLEESIRVECACIAMPFQGALPRIQFEMRHGKGGDINVRPKSLSTDPFQDRQTETPNTPNPIQTTVSEQLLLTMPTAPTSLYPLPPSTPAAIIFTVLDFTVAIYHICIQVIYPRLHCCNNNTTTITNLCSACHAYTIPTALAAGLSTTGYALLIASLKMDTEIGTYASSSSSLIVISPIFVCASLYLLIARLITRCLPPSTPTPTSQKHSDGVGRQKSPEIIFRISPLWISRPLHNKRRPLLPNPSPRDQHSSRWELGAGDSATTGTNILLFGTESPSRHLFRVYRLALAVCLSCPASYLDPAGSEQDTGVKSLSVGVAVASRRRRSEVRVSDE